MTEYSIHAHPGCRPGFRGLRAMHGGGHRRHRGGPWHAGPGHFGAGRRAGRGDIRAAILALLAEAPKHGYQIIREIEERSGGSWKPSPGSVYPTLQQLEDESLVRAQEQDGRRVYRLTDEGQRVAGERAEEFANLWQGVAPSEDDTQLGDLIFQVGAAFVHVARTGTPEQMAQARKVLANTRAELYKIMGDQDGGGRS